MTELILPHQAPIRFAKYVLSKDDNVAVVKNEFETVPSLGMLIEATAQSGAAFGDEDSKGKIGYLTTLKNIKLLTKPTSLEYNITLTLTHKIENFGYISFEVSQDDELVATGSFMVVIT